MAEQPQPPMQVGSTPVPDPTKLTTEAVDRLEHKLTDLFNVRFETIAENLDRLQGQMDTRPAAIVQEINHLRQLMDEKFKGVADQFLGRDTALAAALLAQKTSVEEQNKANAASASKSEAGFTKQIDGALAALVAVDKASADKIEGAKSLIIVGDASNNDKIEDVRTRVGALENQKKGGGDVIVWIFGGIMAAAGLVALIVAVTTFNRPAEVVQIPAPASAIVAH